MSEKDAAVNSQDTPSQAQNSEEADVGQEIQTLRAQLAEAQARANEAREQLLRTAAELDNVRKRAARDVEQAHKFALERFAQELLGVADSLELAVASGASADAASLAAGQEATLRLLKSTFAKFAINEINPVGEPFDPERHEAMVMQPSDTAEPNSVLQVIQRGYELNGRLLRPARVIVARTPDGP
jgi:molecular chaperone GrpE